MDDAATPTRISQVGTVFVPVADQERALEFYLGKAAHETLRGRGVEVDAKVARDGHARHLLFDTGRQMSNATVPPMFFFRDIDGNRFLIVDVG